MTENNASEQHLALWGGRFSSGPSAELARLSKSTQFDWRLADDDIAGSRAHARALGRAGLLTDDELSRMESALDELQRRVDSGVFAPIEDDEDEATALERGLLSIAGDELGGKLRAGRSRNDQIACLIRMWLRRHSRVIAGLLLDLVNALIEQSEKAGRTVMPGRTHMQHAQPVLLAHQLMAHAWPLIRDVQRLIDWDKRINASPYGSGALAGNTLGLDPEAVARELGFSRVTDNSIDGTAARDLVAEFAFVAAMTGVDISRLSEEIIIWNTQEFAFVKLDDGYSTGSSIMPQKKNPDVCELIRGKTGRVFGALTSLLTVMKGLPLAYNKDMQEDKEGVYDAIDTVKMCLKVFAPMFETMTMIPENMLNAAKRGFINATDCADYLTKKGVPFRDAYKATGTLVHLCIEKGVTLDTLPLDEYKKVSDVFEEDVYHAIDLATCVAERRSTGGPAPEEVRRQISVIEAFLQESEA